MRLADLAAATELYSLREQLQQIVNALDCDKPLTIMCGIQTITLEPAAAYKILFDLETENRKALNALGVSDVPGLQRPHKTQGASS